MEKPTTLIMFSGGLDSAGVFWKLINEREELHVHHLYLVNKEGRARAENRAVGDVVEYMRKVRDFGFSESYHEYPCYNGNFMWDSDIFSFMAGSICLRANAIFGAFGTVAEKVYPLMEMTKRQVYEMVPEELRKLTWGCRTPIYDGDDMLECGRCRTCVEMSRIRSPI